MDITGGIVTTTFFEHGAFPNWPDVPTGSVKQYATFYADARVLNWVIGKIVIELKDGDGNTINTIEDSNYISGIVSGANAPYPITFSSPIQSWNFKVRDSDGWGLYTDIGHAYTTDLYNILEDATWNIDKPGGPGYDYTTWTPATTLTATFWSFSGPPTILDTITIGVPNYTQSFYSPSTFTLARTGLKTWRVQATSNYCNISTSVDNLGGLASLEPDNWSWDVPDGDYNMHVETVRSYEFTVPLDASNERLLLLTYRGVPASEHLLASSIMPNVDLTYPEGEIRYIQDGVSVAFTAYENSGYGISPTVPFIYEWDFGDGTGSLEKNPTHIYLAAGTYSPTLTVTDKDAYAVDYPLPAPIVIEQALLVTCDVADNTVFTEGDPITAHFTANKALDNQTLVVGFRPPSQGTFEITSVTENPTPEVTVEGIAPVTGNYNTLVSMRYAPILATGYLAVLDADSGRIRKATYPEGVVTTLAGEDYSAEAITDGPGVSARLGYSFCLGKDTAGNAYFYDDGAGGVIRRIAPDNYVTTIAGTLEVLGGAGTGYQDGPVAAAQFNSVNDICADPSGNLYVTEGLDHTVRKIVVGGTVSTIAGDPSFFGDSNGTGSAAKFRYPCGICWGPDNALYVCDTDNHMIRRVTALGEVTTFAGVSGAYGYTDGLGTNARFYFPEYICFGADGNFYITQRNYVRKMTPAGYVTTLGANPSNSIMDIEADADSNIYLADRYQILKLDTGWNSTVLAGGNPDNVSDGTGAAAGFRQAVKGIALF